MNSSFHHSNPFRISNQEVTLPDFCPDNPDHFTKLFCKEFGTRLKELMVTKGIKQHQVAKRAKLSRQTVAAIIKGDNIELYTVFKLAWALQCDAWELFDGNRLRLLITIILSRTGNQNPMEGAKESR